MSEKHDWETPITLFDDLNREFNFDLDPCCSKETAKCAKFYTENDDGLTQDWSGNVFMNPPYGRQIILWMKKAKEESDKGSTVVCLVPARTDTRWWHLYAMTSSEIRLLNRRLTFAGANNKATFPAAIVIFRPNKNDKPSLGVQKV
jgi:site-specific DNA-methyltransferase (adenine-specific)